jgi:hypothetical protein
MTTQTISPKQAAEMISNAGGRFFTVTFVKRTNNEFRTINCRRGVSKGVKGTSGRKQKTTGLVTVYDMHKKGYRRINLSGVRDIRMNGVQYNVI